MEWTKRDQAVSEQLQQWIETLNEENSNDFKDTYVKWLEHGFSLIPEKIKTQFFGKLDTWLFHLNSLIQSMQIQEDTRNRILSTARVFDNKVNSVSDIKNLTIDQVSYIADQHSARHRLYSFIQGGITGTGKSMALSTDFLMMIILNMRAVQNIAVSYGYDNKTPFEMMTSLKVFHAASLPNRLKGKAMDLLLNDLENQQYFYEGSDQVTDYQWLEEPFKQLAKVYLILHFQKNNESKLSLIPLVIGAGANYKFSRKVTDFADKYYKFRYLYDKGGEL